MISAMDLDQQPDARVVTVSATYGAAGSLIAPKLADALQFRFLDRTVSSATAVAAASPTESPTEEELKSSPPSRWIASLAQLAASVPGVPTADLGVMGSISDLRTESTHEVSGVAADGRVLILGRAAAVVLAGRPAAFHIRLDGPVEARIARAQRIEGIAADEARRRCEATDRMRSLYVRRLYNRDADDRDLYHLVLDSTVFEVDDVVTVLRDAALAFWRGSSR